MANTDISEAHKTHAATTFNLRQELRAITLASQNTEHQFYIEQKKRVARHFTELCSALVRILERIKNNQRANNVVRALVASKVKYELIKSWWTSRLAQTASITATAEAKEEVESANRIKNSLEEGIFFMTAKTGKEHEHTIASAALQTAQSTLINAQKEEQLIAKQLNQAAELLLSDMLLNVSTIATCCYGSEVEAHVMKSKVDLYNAGALHAEQQRKFAAEMRRCADALDRMYSEEIKSERI